MSRKCLWNFRVYNLETGEVLTEFVSFYGADSEMAFVNCMEWATRTYKTKVHCEERE